jgi:hypothetical protein
MNTIVEAQNRPAMLALMRARRVTYRRAEIWQNAQILAMVAAPAAGALLGLLFPVARPFVAVFALAATLFDVWLMDPRQKENNRLAARITETFDCEVLHLPWNEFVAGRRLDPESIDRQAGAFRGSDAELRDWYSPPELALAPLPLARIICQRQNLWYNSDLRRRGVEVLSAIAGILVVSVVVIGVVADLSLTDLTVSVAAPASPILIWALRERVRQREATDAIEQIKTAADAFWNSSVDGGRPDDEEFTRRSREFQDAIYLRRSASALPLPWLYKLLRPSMELSMAAGAAARLREIGVRVGDTID